MKTLTNIGLKAVVPILFALLIMMLLANSCSTPSQPSKQFAPAQFYQGKVITLFVPHPAGSGTDITARNFATYLERYIPGNPRIVIDNRAGAGGAIGLHYYLDDVKADGLSLLTMSSGVTTRWLLHSEGHDYDLRKAVLLMGIPDASVYYINSKVGVKSAGDLLKLGRPVKSGHVTLDSSVAIAERLSAELLGYQVKQIAGYGDYGSETKMAVIRGEVEMSAVDGLAWLNFVASTEAGDIVPLFQDGTGRDMASFPALGDIPALAAVYKDIYGKSPEGRTWDSLRALQAIQISGAILVNKASPPEAIEDLNTGIKEMLAASDFKEFALKQIGTKETEKAYLSGDRALSAWEDVLNTPAEVVALLK